jgi:DnaK suppressor protein
MSTIMAKKNGNASKKDNEVMEEPVLTKTYLTDEELEHFRLLLLKRREEVLRDLDILRSSLSDENVEDSINSNYSMHMADHGTDTMDREQRFMFIARDEKYIGYIDQALDRIRNKVYGICIKSGKPIPKKRLEAVPHTSVRIEFKQGKSK